MYILEDQLKQNIVKHFNCIHRIQVINKNGEHLILVVSIFR